LKRTSSVSAVGGHLTGKTGALLSDCHHHHSQSHHRFFSQDAVTVTIQPMGEDAMNGKSKIAVSLLAGAALGAAAVQVLHAQAKPKAYLVTETELLDPTALATYLPKVREAAKAAGGNLDFIPAGGTVVKVVGEAPKRAGISEWESLEKVQAWIDSPARKELAPLREKVQKITRQFIIELPK
jgi:uncharacterized protein (DUF1330 family)